MFALVALIHTMTVLSGMVAAAVLQSVINYLVRIIRVVGFFL